MRVFACARARVGHDENQFINARMQGQGRSGEVLLSRVHFLYEHCDPGREIAK